MDNLGNSNPRPNHPQESPAPGADANPAIPLEENPAGGPPSVSRAPLNLGGGGSSPVPAPAPKAAAPRPVAPARPAAAPAANERITGCKTFFTKLHPGAIDFLDELITQWLKDNPTVVIKMTNVVTGEIQGKKTEPNVIITVWYHGHAAKAAAHMG
jgi:hypothetical protein